MLTVISSLTLLEESYFGGGVTDGIFFNVARYVMHCYFITWAATPTYVSIINFVFTAVTCVPHPCAIHISSSKMCLSRDKRHCFGGIYFCKAKSLGLLGTSFSEGTKLIGAPPHDGIFRAIRLADGLHVHLIRIFSGILVL